MVTIIYRHSGRTFNDLKIAGDFTNWDVIPMVRKTGSPDNQEYWETSVDLDEFPKDATKIHFKFIDDGGNWFTDDNYAKEIDEHSNENNVKLLSENESNATYLEDIDEGSKSKITDDGPLSPAPSLDDSIERQDDSEELEIFSTPEKKRVTCEDPDEDVIGVPDNDTVGEPAVLVNHSDAEDIAERGNEEEIPKSSGTVLSNKGQDPDQYKNFLTRIIAFFTNLFHNWFS